MSTQIQFVQIAGTSLYQIPTEDTVGWAAYILPPAVGPNPDLPDTITLADSLNTYNGHYLFAHTVPPAVASDPDDLAQDTYNYFKQNVGFSGNRGVAWLEGVDPVKFGTFANFGLSFVKGSTNLVVNQKLDAYLGQDVNFFMAQGLNVSLDASRNALLFSLRNPSTDFIGILKGSNNIGINIIRENQVQQAWLPFTGSNTGCVTFNVSFEPERAFAGGGLQNGLIYTVNLEDSDNPGTPKPTPAYYALFDQTELSTFNAISVIDVSDPTNTRVSKQTLEKGYYRTAFSIPNATKWPSSFRTQTGLPVDLIAQGTTTTDFLPPQKAAVVAIASSSPANSDVGTDDIYFTIGGQFGIIVEGKEEGNTQALITGVYGSESISFTTYSSEENAKNDLLYFLLAQPAYAPIFPFDTASLDNPDSGDVQSRLTDDYTVPWVTLFSGTQQVEFNAEPEGSALYGLKASSPTAVVNTAVSTGEVLYSTPPRLALNASGVTSNTFPMAPYGLINLTGTDIAPIVTTFESQIISPTRKNIINNAAADAWNARKQVLLFADTLDESNIDYGTTPQGLIVKKETDNGTYLDVLLAQSPDRSGNTTVFEFKKPTLQLQAALQSNQLFLVAVNDQYFNTPDGNTFANTLYLTEWKMSAQIGNGVTPTDYRNVMIMKFCEGSLQDRVTNPNRWTSPEQFSLAAGTTEGSESVAYTGLSQWLQQYIEDGIAKANDSSSAVFYENFKNIVTDPDWNGVIVFKADLSPDDIPPQIQGLAAGIDLSQLVAHHFGFTVSRVDIDASTGVFSFDGNSSTFGLVDYEDPAFASNQAAGVPTDTPIKFSTTGAFDFTVLQLKSLFENAKLINFKSNIQLTVEELFATEVLKTYAKNQQVPANGVVLDGSYVDQNGTTSYVFQQTNQTVFQLNSNTLKAVAFNRVQFNTLGDRNNGADLASRFLIWGAFDFVELFDSNDSLLDVLSFGSDKDTPVNELGVGLAFSNLLLDMVFPLATPNSKSFLLSTQNIAFDLNSSEIRSDSLFKGFGLQLKSFVSAPDEKTPASFGFLPVSSNLQLQQINNPWFGIVYEITLGGPGALASAAGFSSNLLLAWAPGTSATETSQFAVFVGMSLPGAAPGAKLFSLQGIFKVGIGSITIQRQAIQSNGDTGSAGKEFYCLRLNDIALKIFGVVKLPPDATIQFFLFGDPSNTGSLGWYAAYVANDNPGCDQQSLGFLPASEVKS